MRNAIPRNHLKVKKNNSDALRLALVTHGPIASSVNSDRKTFRFYSHGIYDDPKCGKLQSQVVEKFC